MTNILLIYPPFCTPASPPYSLTNLYSFLKNNLGKEHNICVLDVNLEFHKLMFPVHEEYFNGFLKDYTKESYSRAASLFLKITKECYSMNNKSVVQGGEPELLKEMVELIKSKKPDIVGLSIVYSSQAFYAVSILKELKKAGIKTIIGGPCVNEKLKENADLFLRNEVEFLEYITGKKYDHKELKCNFVLDYSIYDLKGYFVPEIVLPIRASVSCYYKQCAFCTHHRGGDYAELSLENVKNTIQSSGQKHFFFIDEMIHKKRLLDIAKILKPLNVNWSCQLRPTADLDRQTLDELHDSGLNLIMWGVESGCQRVLDLIRKGTNVKDIQKVIMDSHDAGIKNVLYIMFGFPSETKEEFLQTINFLKENKDNFDLVSPTVFGLQHDAPMMKNLADYGITNVNFEKRTILEPKITYDVSTGLSQKDASELKEKYKKTFDLLSKYPQEMNFFREHMQVLCKD